MNNKIDIPATDIDKQLFTKADMIAFGNYIVDLETLYSKMDQCYNEFIKQRR